MTAFIVIYCLMAAVISIGLVASQAYDARRIIIIASTWPVWVCIAIVVAFAWYFCSGWSKSDN